MNFNLVEMYNGLLRFNKHILKINSINDRVTALENASQS